MDDRRRKVFRREPITIDLESGLELVARPLPWQTRNDLGDLIMQDYIAAMNESLQALRRDDDSAPQLIGGLADKLKHLDQMFKLAFPDVIDDQVIEQLTYDELIECLFVAMEVNNLTKLRPLIDPNFLVPDQISGETPGQEEAPVSGQKSKSLQGSSEKDSEEK
jgi:hypothetical protein